MKTVQMEFYGKTYNLAITRSQYSNNKTLYLGLYDVDNREPFADITVNLPESYARGNVQYIDTNDLPEIEEFIKKNEFGFCIGSGTSGFCRYPLYCFNMKKLAPYIMDSGDYYG